MGSPNRRPSIIWLLLRRSRVPMRILSSAPSTLIKPSQHSCTVPSIAFFHPRRCALTVDQDFWAHACHLSPDSGVTLVQPVFVGRNGTQTIAPKVQSAARQINGAICCWNTHSYRYPPSTAACCAVALTIVL